MMDAGKLGRILKSMEEHDVPQLIISDPVSYTHLDVYKRQAFRRDGGLGTGGVWCILHSSGDLNCQIR